MSTYSRDEARGKIEKYMEQLEREDKIRHALSRLDKIDMTLDLLQETKVGIAVNKLKSHDDFGNEAKRIILKWKDIAQKGGAKNTTKKQVKKEASSDEDDSHRSSSSGGYEREHAPPVRKRSREESPTPCRPVKQERRSPSPIEQKPVKMSKETKAPVKVEPGAFESMLAAGNVKTVRTKKPKPPTDIDVNYRPLPMTLNLSHVPRLVVPAATQEKNEEDEPFNPEKMFRPRKDLGRKVYAGRRKGPLLTEVPRLFDSCLKVLVNNIDAIEETGEIPYDILQPVLEKCTPSQLHHIESRNPYLEEDTDALWEKIVLKDHPTAESPHDETWREAYYRLLKEKDDRLKYLSQRIGQSHKAEAEKGKRTAKLADATAPREVRRRAAKFGTVVSTSRVIPSAIEVSQARRQIFETGNKSSLTSIPNAVINRTSTVGAKRTSSAGVAKPVHKKGALMAKTMKMLNMKRR